MLLDKSDRFIEILLGGSPGTEANWAAEYEDQFRDAKVPGILNLGVTNSAVPVTIVPPPAISTARFVREILVYNADAGTIDVIIQYNDGTARVVKKTTLTPGQTLTYNAIFGWQVN